MIYSTHSINSAGFINVRMVKDGGGFHRYCLAPGADLTGQPQEVVDAAKEAWTQEVIDAYQAMLAENELPEPTLEEKTAQVEQQRKHAYIHESDPLFMEAYRKRLTGANGEADDLEAQGHSKVDEIKSRYPWPDEK